METLWSLAKERAENAASEDDARLIFGETMYDMLALEASSHPVNCLKVLGTSSGILYPQMCIRDRVPKQQKLHIPVQQHEKIYKLAIKNRSTPKDTPMVRVGRLELPASCSQTCVGTFKRHSIALFGPFRRSGNSSLTLFCPACFKQNFLLLGWVWDWILYIKRCSARVEGQWLSLIHI